MKNNKTENQPFTIISMLPDNVLNIQYHHVTASNAEQALKGFPEGVETVVTIVTGHVNKALEDEQLMDLLELV